MNYFLFFPRPVLAFLLGGILSFSLPPYSFTFLSFLVFPFFLYLLLLSNKESNKFIFLIGYLFGLSYFAFSLYWISYSLNFDENLKILKPLALIFVPSILAFFYGIGCLLIKKYISNSFYFILIFSTVFASMEFLRGLLFTGFPWNLFVYTWSWSLESIQILSLIGTYSFNFLTLIIFSLPFLLFNQVTFKKFFFIVFVVFLIVFSNYCLGLYLLKNNHLTKIPNFKVNIIQPNQNIDELLNQDGYSKYIDKLIKLSDPQKYKEQNILFVWPEGVILNSSEINQYSDLFSINFSNTHQIVLGTTSYKSDRFYNSLFLLDKNAKIITSYEKIKLVPFGEFIPFYDFFEKINFKKITFGYGSFSNGVARKPVQINNDLKFLPLICYEVIFSGLINLEKENYDFILNISEDGWFNKSIGTAQHFVHSKFRAIEEGKHIVRVTNQGITSSIRPDGFVDKMINFNEKTSFNVDIYKKKQLTFFSIYLNKVFYLLIFLSFVVIFFLKKKYE